MKNIYDVLNDVQTDVQAYEIEPVRELDKKRMKKALRQRTGKRSYKKAAGVACAVVLLTALAVPNEIVYAAGEYSAWHIENFMGIDRDLQDYVTVVGTSQTDNGYTIRLDEVALNQGSLIVSTNISKEGASEDEMKMIVPTGQVYINGLPVWGGISGGSRVEANCSVQSVVSYDLGDIDTSEELDIKLVYRQIGQDDSKSISGKWKFYFTADGSALAENTVYVPLNKQFTLPNGVTVTLTKYAGNALEQRVYYTTAGGTAMDRSDYHLRLQGVDDQGQEIVFETRRADGQKGTGYMSCEILGAQITEDTKWLELTPYAVAFPKESGRMSHDYQPMGEPFHIEVAQ